ncbi:peptidase M23 [Candidatus Parcubacteria bacterium]|nr:MAG: peptidase M23 [Candidatus Parcubacteria bacterium]
MHTDIQERSRQLVQALHQHKKDFHSVVPFDLHIEPVTVFDLTGQNEELTSLDLSNTHNMNEYIFGMMKRDHTRLGIGRYDEDRVIYKRSELFDTSQDDRTIHLGIDLWVEAGMPVNAPLASRVHSFQDNNNFGDYGPTIILEHELDGVVFYTLYGHLSRESLENISVGQEISAGEEFATVGNFPINGDWPPHLHFQIVLDMGEKTGDFPGVASIQERDYYTSLCPDPNMILGLVQTDTV